MTTKEYLSQAFTIQRLIKVKENRIKDLRDMLDRSTMTFSNTKVQTSPKNDPMGDFVATIVDLETECREDIARLLSIQMEIEAVVSTVEQPEHRIILFERYVNLKRWEDIAEDHNYGLRHVHKLHNAGLAKIKWDGEKCAS